eukprot:747482-Hanusia_phi.AAC.2
MAMATSRSRVVGIGPPSRLPSRLLTDSCFLAGAASSSSILPRHLVPSNSVASCWFLAPPPPKFEPSALRDVAADRRQQEDCEAGLPWGD